MRRFRYVLADVFTDRPLEGNQLAVFTDARDLTGEEMQQVAREMNLSETVFVLPPSLEDADVRIRIFTPGNELPFAGHPTLGAALVLAAPLQLGVVRLETGVGTVPVVIERDESGRVVFGRMTQPVPRIEPVERPERVVAAVGAARSQLPVELYDNGARHIVLLVEERELGALRPDREAIAEFAVTGVNCVAKTSDAWRSRMFWEHGEDPATGSAAGPIACHLARHGLVPWGDEIEIAQGVEMGRPSTLHARAEGGEGAITAVEVGGSAVVVARGEFRV